MDYGFALSALALEPLDFFNHGLKDGVFEHSKIKRESIFRILML